MFFPVHDGFLYFVPASLPSQRFGTDFMIPPGVPSANPVFDEALMRLRVSAFNYPPTQIPNTAIVSLSDLQSLIRHVDRLHNVLKGVREATPAIADTNRFLVDSVPW